jgi:hypothetical protein
MYHGMKIAILTLYGTSTLLLNTLSHVDHCLGIVLFRFTLCSIYILVIYLKYFLNPLIEIMCVIGD